MSTATTQRASAVATGDREFTCAEVRGGNRPIDSPLRLPGVVGHIYSHPCAGGRGGDIHYISLCSSGLTSRLCLADVAGHGEAVAEVSDEIHGQLVRYMNNIDETRILANLNRRLMKGRLRTMTTAASVSYLPPLRLLSVSYAGHPPGWLYRKADDRWERLSVPRSDGPQRVPVDMPLGVDAATRFRRRRVRVRAGDRLLLVTDGVLEAPAPGGEMYGEHRLGQFLQERRQLRVAELASEIVAAVTAHTQDARLPHDDVTLLLVEFVAGPRALGVWEVVRNRLLGGRRQALPT